MEQVAKMAKGEIVLDVNKKLILRILLCLIIIAAIVTPGYMWGKYRSYYFEQGEYIQELQASLEESGNSYQSLLFSYERESKRCGEQSVMLVDYIREYGTDCSILDEKRIVYPSNYGSVKQTSFCLLESD